MLTAECAAGDQRQLLGLVGTVVPRTVRLVAVPATLIEIHPAWRGYMYFVDGDEIIIVEPGTLRIVAVLDV